MFLQMRSDVVSALGMCVCQLICLSCFPNEHTESQQMEILNYTDLPVVCNQNVNITEI